MSKNRNQPRQAATQPVVEEQQPTVETPVENEAATEESAVTEPTVEPVVEEAAPVQPEPTPEPTPEPVPAPVVEEKETVRTFLLKKNKGLTAIPPNTLHLLGLLEKYVEAMMPNVPANPKDGASHQRSLYNIFISALTLKSGEHRIALDGILYVMNEHRMGAFSERYAMRFMDTTRLDAASAISFQRLLHLFILTANPAKRRDALKQLDMRRIIEKLDVMSQQNLLDYYR